MGRVAAEVRPLLVELEVRPSQKRIAHLVLIHTFLLLTPLEVLEKLLHLDLANPSGRLQRTGLYSSSNPCRRRSARSIYLLSVSDLASLPFFF